MCRRKVKEILLQGLEKIDYPVLLDEKGKQFNSAEFSIYSAGHEQGIHNLGFVIGGPFGFRERNAVRRSPFRQHFHISSYGLFLEQLYRATIIEANHIIMPEFMKIKSRGCIMYTVNISHIPDAVASYRHRKCYSG
jgi:23S rRNA pseudoU1915 N3-methylase RlmH